MLPSLKTSRSCASKAAFLRATWFEKAEADDTGHDRGHTHAQKAGDERNGFTWLGHGLYVAVASRDGHDGPVD